MAGERGAAIEVLARGVCVRGKRLLLCHTRGAKNTYLPGGHVEFGEPAARSLEREIREELGRRARARGFLGAVEHRFTQRGRRHCEINLVFAVTMAGLHPARPPRSREGHLDFRWVPLSRLREARLEPRPLCRLLPRWLKSRRAGGPRWASTYPDPS